MLAELAAANAAFAIIKKTLQNSGEIASAAQSIADWFNAKNEIQKRVEAKPEDKRSDLEEFFALEQLKQQQQELKEMMIYQGRPGLWEDWQRFQVEARRAREAEAAAETRRIETIRKRRRALLEQILLGFWLTVLAVVLTGMIIGGIYLYTQRGR
jgi:hypothetical protein